MKKLVVILSASVFVLSLSSCYRQKVCATYVKAEKKIEKTAENKNIIDKYNTKNNENAINGIESINWHVNLLFFSYCSR